MFWSLRGPVPRAYLGSEEFHVAQLSVHRYIEDWLESLWTDRVDFDAIALPQKDVECVRTSEMTRQRMADGGWLVSSYVIVVAHGDTFHLSKYLSLPLNVYLLNRTPSF